MTNNPPENNDKIPIINLRLAAETKDQHKSYVLSGSKSIVERLADKFGEGEKAEDKLKDFSERFSCFIDFSTVASSLEGHDTTMTAFLTVIDTQKRFGGQADLLKRYVKVVEPLRDTGRGVFYHPKFFHQPDSLFFHPPHCTKTLWSKGIVKLSNAARTIIKEINEKFPENIDPDQKMYDKITFQMVDEGTYYSQGSFPLTYKEFLAHIDNASYYQDTVENRRHVLHLLYDERLARRNIKNDESLLICLPIVGYSYNNVKFQGLGAVFVYLVGPRDGIDNIKKGKIDEICRELDYLVKNITYYYSFAVAHELSEKMRRFAMRSAVSAIMSRNMSHNLGSHVLTRLRQDALSGNEPFGGNSDTPPAVFDPMQLVIEDATNALGTAGISDDFIRHRIGAAIHYLEWVHDQVPLDPNERPGTPRQEIFAKDMKVLTAYLQQRMDFIAHVCTAAEGSHWTSSACLCHDVMAHFLRQSKVLEYIAASEDLTAAKFKKEGNGKIRLLSPDRNKHGCIKFLMRYQKRGSEEFEEVLNFDTEDGVSVNPTRIPIAFPGGRNGWQAFYVIIESVLRNFAKHSYGEYIKNSPNQKEHPDLEIVIDVIDRDEEIKVWSEDQKDAVPKPAYTVRVYSNVSLIPKKQKINGTTMDLCKILQDKLAKSFINDQGKLKKANWGLAEFRVAAGYLRQAEIMDIGGEVNNTRTEEFDESRMVVAVKSNIVSPRSVTQLYYKKNRSSPAHFYYEFKLLKPQIIAIEIADKCEEVNDRKNEGWRFFTSKDSANLRMFDYYVLDGCTGAGKKIVDAMNRKNGGVDDFPLDTYPGRLFVVVENADGDHWKKYDTSLRKRVCLLDSKDYKKNLIDIYNDEKSKSGDVTPTEQAVQFLQKKWVEHLMKCRTGVKEEKSLTLFQYINDEEDASGAGEGIYVPNTTPFRTTKKNGTQKKIQLLNGKDGYSLVFGRHWGLLERANGNLTDRANDKNRRKELPQGPFLYAESMSGNCSYFSFAQHAFDGEDKHRRDLLQLAEAALMRVVIIDERVQEGFIKVREEKSLIGSAEQQVFIGYLQDTSQKTKGGSSSVFDQKQPTGALVEKTGYVTVTIGVERQTVTGPQICLKRCPKWKYECNTTNNYKDTDFGELWPNEGLFQPDILIIHQGILDKWVDGCQITFDEPDANVDIVAKYNSPKQMEDWPSATKRAKIGLLIDVLKSKVPHVIITSGRGLPNEMPQGVRFLPLSAFADAPQGGVYEKFPLVQQVMSIVESRTNNG